MTEYALRLENGKDTALRLRRGDALALTPAGALQAQAGLRNDGGGEVTVVPGTMQVQVTPFVGWVDGAGGVSQGGYPFVCDAAKTLTLEDGHATLERVDTIAARVAENALDGSGITVAQVLVVTGEPGAGVPVLPGGHEALWDVIVPAGTSAGTGGLSTSNLGTDRRRFTAAAGGVVSVSGATERDALQVQPGTVVYRRDTGELQWLESGAWQTIQVHVAEPEWVEVTTFGSGFSARGVGFPPAYRVWPNGKVEWRGQLAKSSNIADANVAWTVPLEARPAALVSVVVGAQYGGGGTLGFLRLDVETDGKVYARGGNAGQWLSLDGVTYYKS